MNNTKGTRLMFGSFLACIALILLILIFKDGDSVSVIYKTFSVMFYVFAVLYVLYVSDDEVKKTHNRKCKIKILKLPLNLLQYDVVRVENLSKIKKLAKKNRKNLLKYHFNSTLSYYYIKKGQKLYLYKDNKKEEQRAKIKMLAVD